MSSRERYIAWYRSEYSGRDPSDGVTTAWKAWQARDAEVAHWQDELARLADFYEPHWKGAGLPLSSEWILKEAQEQAFGKDDLQDQVERLVEALREARTDIEAMSFGDPVPGSWRDRVDALLREYTQKEKRDE